MPTIQDTLREEARDYQELAAMDFRALLRMSTQSCWSDEELAAMQRGSARLYRTARSALLELIGTEPE